MENKLKIKFYTRSFSLELYSLSSQLYRETGYPCVRLTDQTADGYFYTMLFDEDCDIAINVDEDCFITDMEAVFNLVKRMEKEGWVNLGCSDAGKGVPRKGDETITNPFFNVFNLKTIRAKWNASKLIPKFKKDRFKGFEPYYPFFYWINQTFPNRTLYLKSDHYSDQLSTALFENEESQYPFCIHTWYARFYHPSFLAYCFEGGYGFNHSKRIDSVIDDVYSQRNLKRPSFSILDKCLFAWDGFKRWLIKIPQRVVGWPKKIKRKYETLIENKL